MRSVKRALTEKRTLRGGGALEFLDLRLFEDGGERRGALGSDAVVRDAVSEGQDGNGERVGVSTGADTKANTQELVRKGGVLLERLQRQVALEARCNRGSSFGTELVVLKTAGWGLEVSGEPCQWELTQKRTLLGGGALERGHGAPLEPLAQLGDALSGVGAVPPAVDAAELVVGQTAKEG